MRKWMVALLAAAAWTVAGVAAQACQSKTLVYEDTFERFEPTWGSEDFDYYVEDGKLLVDAYEDLETAVFNQFSYYYDSADICVTVTNTDVKKSDDTTASIVFWVVDYDNYYACLIDPQGQAAIFRVQKGKLLFQVKWTKFDAVKKGEGATNDLRVLVKGKSATFFVNGKQFRQFNGVPPKDGWTVGVRAFGAGDDGVTYAFDDFKVTTE